MKAIIFDFDGVILDSVDVKTKAFKQMYSIYGDDVMRKVVDYHLLNGGISRYKKFKYFHENFLMLFICAKIIINQMQAVPQRSDSVWS